MDSRQDTQTWHTPKSAPTNGEKLRVWIDECNGFEDDRIFYAKDDERGMPLFVDIHGDYMAIALWRYADEAPRPSDDLVARSHAEFEEWDNA